MSGEISWLKARPTAYKGVQMRSRLEALYAQSLDASGTQWQYEPQCFADEHGQYLPDFRADLGGPADGIWWVEVKPQGADLDAALAKMHRILATEPDAMLSVAINEGSYEAPRFKHWAVQCCPVLPCGKCERLNPSDLHLVVEHSDDRQGPYRPQLQPPEGYEQEALGINGSTFVACGHCQSTNLHVRQVGHYDCQSEGIHAITLKYLCSDCGRSSAFSVRWDNLPGYDGSICLEAQ